jgi:uncharacterized membrane protein
MEQDIDLKHIFQSRTFWTNLLGPIFLWLGTKYGIKLDEQTQGIVILIIMSLANIGLRYFTKQPVTLSFQKVRQARLNKKNDG